MAADWKRKKFLDFPLKEYKNRLETFRKHMQEEDIDGAVVTQKENVVYFTGFRTALMDSKYWTQGMGAVISLDQDPVLFTTSVDYHCAKTLCWMDDDNIRQWSPVGANLGGDKQFDTGEGLILSILKELELDRATIAFEIGLGGRMAMPYDQFQRMLAKLPNASIKDACAPIMKTREIKSDAEIERIREACHVTDLGIDAVWKALDDRWKSGITQIELEQEYAAAIAKAGGQLLFFNCKSGPPYMDKANADSLRLKIKRGDIVSLDLGATYKWYQSDFMRLAFVGGKPKKEWADMVEVVREAQMACIEMLKPGANGAECWKACTDIVKKADYWDDFLGGGHGIGLERHELPRLYEATFQKGMVPTVEPAIYPARCSRQDDPDAPGFWLEEVVAITEDGYEILSSYDPEPYIVL